MRQEDRHGGSPQHWPYSMLKEIYEQPDALRPSVPSGSKRSGLFPAHIS
jgi:hypothetical protein